MSLDLGAIRTTLESERASLDAELDALTSVTRDPAATIGFGKRVGEGTSEAVGRIERVGQADALAAKLASVRRALGSSTTAPTPSATGAGPRSPTNGWRPARRPFSASAAAPNRPDRQRPSPATLAVDLPRAPP